jgi:hypothetical protein
MTLASLNETFAGRTNAQGDKLMERHCGKPVRVSGTVERVELAGPHVAHSVRLRGAGGVLLLLFFDPADPNTESALLTLNHDDRIVVSGEIHRIMGELVALGNCLLLEPRRRVS